MKKMGLLLVNKLSWNNGFMEFLLLYERVLLRMCIMRRLKNKLLGGLGEACHCDNQVLCMASSFFFFFLFSFFFFYLKV